MIGLSEKRNNSKKHGLGIAGIAALAALSGTNIGAIVTCLTTKQKEPDVAVLLQIKNRLLSGLWDLRKETWEKVKDLK